MVFPHEVVGKLKVGLRVLFNAEFHRKGRHLLILRTEIVKERRLLLKAIHFKAKRIGILLIVVEERIVLMVCFQSRALELGWLVFVILKELVPLLNAFLIRRRLRYRPEHLPFIFCSVWLNLDDPSLYHARPFWEVVFTGAYRFIGLSMKFVIKICVL